MRRFTTTATAQKLGLSGRPIEFPPISVSSRRCATRVGQSCSDRCLSAHYRQPPPFEGEEVQASIEKAKPGQNWRDRDDTRGISAPAFNALTEMPVLPSSEGP